MTLDLANVTKADVYAAAQDLGERLARQIALNKVLHEDLNKLASRPCLECDVVTPVLQERADLLEAELRGALCMLDLVKAKEGSLHVGTVEQFIRDRAELNATFERLTKLPTEATNGPA
tara:strand:- start:307 stop:663 length:357 start_codon:yes stop_codon:yes gene_type:complete